MNGSLKVSTGIERYLGYQKAMKENGLEERPEFIFNGNFTVEDGKKAVAYFQNLAEVPTAILSFNNTMTFGVILQLTTMGLTIPKDIVVASYGETEAAQLLQPPGIVSVKQSPYNMGIRVGQILIDRLIHNVKVPTHEIFNPIIDIGK